MEVENCDDVYKSSTKSLDSRFGLCHDPGNQNYTDEKNGERKYVERNF